MPLADQIRDLADRAQLGLSRGQAYYDHTLIAWRVFRERVEEGRMIHQVNDHTGQAIDGPALVVASQGYVTGYLTESVFLDAVAIFEDYVIGLIGAWLMAHPRGIIGLDDEEGDDRLKRTDKTIPLAIVTDNPDRESILRVIVDRELDRLKYRRLAGWFEYLEKRAGLGVPGRDEIEGLAEIKAARDIIAHNRGSVNATYLAKSGPRARHAEGDRLEITEPYLKGAWTLIARVVDDTSAAAIAKAG